MTRKLCSSCKQQRSVTQFSKKKKSKDGLQSVCKQCQKKYHDKHYQQNKQAYIQKEKRNKRQRLDWLQEYKHKKGCEKCGENHPACLDFHHTDPTTKTGYVSRIARNSIKKALEEIKKCQLLCSNCHRKEHYDWNAASSSTG
jgi:hypothetical protein